MIQLDIQDAVAHLSLNRPDVRNAFDDKMIEELTQAFQQLQSNEEIRVVVLKGNGKSFSAGGDLNWMKSMVNFSKEQNVADSDKLYEMYKAMSEVPVPIVAKVQGHAMGGGLGLMACCDLVTVVDETKMSFSEVRLGLAPAVISSFVAKKTPMAQLYRYFLTAEVFGPEVALQLGLAHHNGNEAACEDWLLKMVKTICNNGPVAVRATKKLLNELPNATDPKQMTSELIASLRVGDEGQEGLKAFFEKRKPSWLQ